MNLSLDQMKLVTEFVFSIATVAGSAGLVLGGLIGYYAAPKGG